MKNEEMFVQTLDSKVRDYLGMERALSLARALRCHPAVLVFPDWDVKGENAAQQTTRIELQIFVAIYFYVSSPFDSD
jgi:hypothetical protein